ncbi:MAG: helicase-associated domain-containing protein [Micrococcales bacterium]|nr:helicase-associated domain-containing protein [Micrococcales bacterium]
MNAPADDLLTWLELAAIAGLIGPANDTVRPTPAAETWLHADPTAMWATLVDSWLDSDRPLGACQPEELGSLTLTGKPRTAHHRRHVLAVWPPHADLLQETVAWERPRMHEAQAQAAGFLDEAVRLGLVVGGVPTVAMAALPDDVAAAAAEVPAADSGGLIVQPDHTVIAPLSVDTGTWRLLQDVAHVESWGPVTTHRIDPARLRTVVAGREPDELLQRLARMSRTPLPQSVEYLVRDAARATAARVYRATVVEAGGADTAALTELGLTRVTDHLFTTDLPLTVVEQQLAAAGISVAAHAEPVAGTPFDVQRVAAVPDEHSVNRLVGLLLGEHALSDVGPPTLQDADPATMVDVCLEAIGKEQRLWVQYPDGDLDRIELIEPIEVRSGRLTGWSLTAGRTLGVPLARIAAYRSAQ